MRGWMLLLVTACGRVDFDRLTDASGEPAVADVAVTSCTSGQRLAPMTAINTSLSAAADACSLDAALARDGLTAGLDRGTVAPCMATWDPNGECGCLAVDLGAAYALSSVSVWEAPVAQACGTACQAPDCGTGHGFTVFVATDLASPTVIGKPTQDATALTEAVVPAQQVARYVMVCRQAWSSSRDDIAIDYIDAVCQ